MPAGAKVLTAREQGDDVCLWAEVDPAAALEMRRFAVYSTGSEIPVIPGIYIGTAMLAAGRLVLHVYESPNYPPSGH